MKKPLIAGATVLVAGVVAFAFARDAREEPEAVEAPVAQASVEEPAVVELADPGVIADEPAEEAPEELPPGWEVDETGFVWEPLSYDKPQLRNNGDGTVTMRKLARIYEADGTMREVPVTATATITQKRVPRMKRTLPAYLQPEQPEEAEDSELSQDGE
jgi:hypothetical protein